MQDIVQKLKNIINEKNMSYCRFHNTLIDLRDCASVLNEIDMGSDDEDTILSEEEREAAIALISLCKQIAEVDEHILVKRNKE